MMRLGPPTFALLCGFVACCAPSISQEPSEGPTAEIQDFLSRWYETGRFEGVVLVAQGDSVFYQGAFGMANREWGVPHTMETRFDIGSIGKQFTTVLTLQLVAEGILKLDVPITDYLPEYRADTGSHITVDHLLRQASGIPCYVRDWRPTPEERARGRPRLLRRHLSPETLIRDYMSGDLLFEPGSRYYYSNTNHFLLARIIENVTGRSFEENLKARLLEPLGLEDTGLLHPGRVIPRLASGYVRIPEGEGRAPYYHPPSLWGTGGMYSTAPDLHAWNRAMEKGVLLPDSLNDLLFTPFIRDEEGFQHAYAVNPTALRLETGQEPTSFTGFSGAIDGFRTDVFRYPDTGFIVVILDNAEHYEHWRMAPGIYLILTGHDPEVPRELASRAVAREALAHGVDAGVTRAREIQAEPRPWSGLELVDLDLDEYASRYLAIDRGDEALLLWKLQIALAPDSPNGWRSLAAGHAALGQDSLAAEAREQADLLTRRAEELMALMDAEQYDTIRERIQALETRGGPLALFSSSDIGPRFGRAFQEGDLERARRIAEIWALGNPTSPGPHFSLANVYKAMGDTVWAIQCYRRILELQPEGALGDRARAEIALLGGNEASSGLVPE
jgi:CubicO group peptidase (beta-lactamase class C family)